MNELRCTPIPQTAEQIAARKAIPCELKELATPLVLWLRENYGPCAEISITWDFVQVRVDDASIPFPYYGE